MAANQQERKGGVRVAGIQWWQGGMYLELRDFNVTIFLDASMFTNRGEWAIAEIMAPQEQGS